MQSAPSLDCVIQDRIGLFDFFGFRYLAHFFLAPLIQKMTENLPVPEKNERKFTPEQVATLIINCNYESTTTARLTSLCTILNDFPSAIAKANNRSAWFDLAVCYELSGDMKTSLQFYTRVANEGGLYAIVNLATYYRHKEKNIKLAEQWYARAIHQHNDDFSKWELVCMLLQTDVKSGISQAKKLLSLTPHFANELKDVLHHLKLLELKNNELTAQNQKLTEENQKLTEENLHLRNSPDPGPDYVQAKTEFETLASGSPARKKRRLASVD